MLKESHFNFWVDKGNKSYVFNGVSGSLLCLPKELRGHLKQFLQNDPTGDCSLELLKNMVYGRMLVPDDEDEIALLKRRFEAERTNYASLALTILPTLSCNFNCLYCYENKRSQFMAKDVELALLAFLENRLAKLATFFVSWYGGEPLLRKEQLFRLSNAFIKRCDDFSIKYSSHIITNGYLLDEQTCTRLRDCKVANAQITLDGPPAIHNRMRPLAKGGDTFWPIVENIRHAVDYMNICVRVNFDKNNLYHAEDLMRILADEGFSHKIRLSPGKILTTDAGRSYYSRKQEHCLLTDKEFSDARQNFDSLAADYGFPTSLSLTPLGVYCSAPRLNECVVGPGGELYKCWISVGDSRETVGTLWNYQKTDKNLRKWTQHTPFRHKNCLKCLILPVCMGGCAHSAQDPVKQESECDAFRRAYQEQITGLIRDS